MSLEDLLDKVRASLSSGMLTSEAQVRGAVISPLLQSLGWNPAEPTQWLQEWPVDSGKVDDALFGASGKPLVFVEAKKHGNLNPKAEDQLFGYAANRGVPLLVLTDGDTWDLYLSMAEGEPAERRFAHFSISEAKPLGSIAEDFDRFLRRDRVVAGDARASAEERLKRVKDREQGRRGLQAAWKTLLAEPDEILRDLLMEQVEEDAGSRPWQSDAEAFLRDQASTVNRPQAARSRVPPAPTSQVMSGRLSGFGLVGKEHRASSGAAAYRLLAAVLQARDSSVLPRWSETVVSVHQAHPRAVKDGHPILLSDAGNYYHRIEACPGWWLNTSLSAKNLELHMRRLVEVAGLTWGTEVKPIFA